MPAATSRNARRRLVSEINVVPYIDVTLVLLIIFMVTAPLVTTGVVDLPSVSKASVQPAKPIEIIIRADESMAINDRNSTRGEQPMVQGDIINYILQAQKTNPDTPVVISADRNLKYDSVLKVMDQLQRRNVKRVGLSVKAGGKSSR